MAISIIKQALADSPRLVAIVALGWAGVGGLLAYCWPKRT